MTRTSDWPRVELGSVATINWGDTSTTKAAYVEEGYAAYSASGRDGYLPYADHDQPGVVLSAIGANCGKTWLASGGWSCIKNTMWFRSASSDVLTEYLYYATADPSHWPRRGAAQPFIALADAKRIEVLLPPTDTQRVIVAILSGYDDLIEINTRRLRILEEMAQGIYREWFVEFRFPGHENVPLEESEVGPVPSGWEVMSFGSLGDYLNGFAFKPTHWTQQGLPIIKIKELKNGVTSDTPRWSGVGIPAKYLVANGDLLFSWSGDLDAYIWRDGAGWLNQHLFKVTPANGVPKFLLYHALRNRMYEFRSRSQGTTMKHIKRAALTEVQTVVPPAWLRDDFNEVVEPIENLRLNLRAANSSLRAMRDFLLPRLISSEEDVSDLPIDMSE